ncbi:PAT complex subunit CCDC47-like isoform X1 [Dreissena polymorpha]|uniref:PAT complex subunit CCDC47-like isoform X1 n=1 Tax=Dreissena polymorpha TaxID=45954 RepID=UPI002263BE71|nr:PAT complex subunit CCDC47-like isoform X1 [Dreissena polymorpha]
MKLTLALSLVLLVFLCQNVGGKKSHKPADLDDNEFAEFEDFDDEGVLSSAEQEATVEEEADFPSESDDIVKTQAKKDDDNEEEEDEGVVENDDDEFEHFTDEDEFEGFDKESRPGKGKSHEVPDLKIAKVPIHLRTNWDSFYLEMLMLAGLGVYFLNFLAGKTKNGKLAQAWMSSHRSILEENFAIIGDDGLSKEAKGTGVFNKESENVYTLWCSGRTCVEGMLVELRLLKRQDLINVMTTIMKPASDQIIVKVTMDASSMDKFCFCIGQKKVMAKLLKEQPDLGQFTEKKAVENYNLPESFQLQSEIGEATSIVLDKKVCAYLEKYEQQIEYIHISDQYSGAKSQYDENQSKMPDVRPSLVFCFNVPGKGKTKTSDVDGMLPLMKLVFYCVDKVGRLALSKEKRLKAEKNRAKAAEGYLKAAHSQLQEAAQLRREEKRRLAKEKIMNEEDPEKARKWEERESKRDMKKKQAKTKMMKVKGM